MVDLVYHWKSLLYLSLQETISLEDSAIKRILCHQYRQKYMYEESHFFTFFLTFKATMPNCPSNLILGFLAVCKIQQWLNLSAKLSAFFLLFILAWCRNIERPPCLYSQFKARQVHELLRKVDILPRRKCGNCWKRQRVFNPWVNNGWGQEKQDTHGKPNISKLRLSKRRLPPKN